MPKIAAEEKNPPTVAFCELIKHPELYDNRIVRTQAISAIGFESQVIYDPQCSTKETRVWAGSAESSVKSNEEAPKIYFALLYEKNPQRYPLGRSGRARATLVGRFEASKADGYGHLNQYRFQFGIMRIEKAEKVADDVPNWP